MSLVAKLLSGCLTVLAVGGVSGCAASPGARADAAHEVVQSLVSAVDSGDGRAACRLLSSAAAQALADAQGKPCSKAILSIALRLSGTADNAVVYGRTAQVSSDEGVAFLALFDGRWKVFAVGCSAQPDRPYDCVVEGK